MKSYTCASFFAGVGGIDIGFEQAGFSIVYANEFDAKAVETYEHNSTVKVDSRDINLVNANELTPFNILLAGFPCQAFSVAGNREGFEDKKGRGILFFELIRIIKFHLPEVIFLENVKNLVGHDNGNTFRIILNELEALGYEVKYQVLNAMTHGNVPQNRERIYIVAFMNHETYKNFDFPKPIKLTTSISDIIDFDSREKEIYYYDKEHPYYDTLFHSMTKPSTMYQWRRVYVRENKSNVCPTLTANMGTGGHNVPLIKTQYGIRKLTPIECFHMQGFPLSFRIPAKMANSHAYKQAGNSVVVPVVNRIAREIMLALQNS